MPDEARGVILSALNQVAGAPVGPAHWRRPQETRALDQTVLTARFTAAASERGVTVTREVGAGAARLSILSFLRRADVRQVLVWEQEELPVPGLLDALHMLGIETTTPSAAALRSGALVSDGKMATMGMSVGLAGLADQGSIVVRYPGAASMLAAAWPTTHLVLLSAANLAPSFESWVAGARLQGRLADWIQHDMTIVSGPSLTMDIEQIPVRGASGPTHLHIFLIEDDIKL
jgi:L-lactate utilization protein LutC